MLENVAILKTEYLFHIIHLVLDNVPYDLKTKSNIQE